MTNKTNGSQHMLLDANIYGLVTSSLCVVEYSDNENDLYPKNVFFISQYDEMEDTLNHTFDLFPLLNDIDFSSCNSNFDKFNLVSSTMNEKYFEGNIFHTEIDSFDVVAFYKETKGIVLDEYDVELEHLNEFIKSCVHKQFVLETKLQKSFYETKNPMQKLLIENKLNELKEKRLAIEKLNS